jgi:cysteine desulfurase / selenocysteine lyase
MNDKPTADALFDAEAFRRQFPLFAQAENAQLVYLDNAATTQKPQMVIDAVAGFYLHSNANAHRSSHRLARAATSMLEQVREKVARHMSASSADEIVFCRGATEGLNLLAASLTQQLRPGDEIILSVAEHHANLVPWQMAAQRHGLQLKFLPLREDGNGIAIDRISELLTARTRIVSLTAASNALGFAVDIAQVAHLIRDSKAALRDGDTVYRKAVLVVDAAQAMAHADIDVQQWACDFLVCSAHKFYGPTGIGFIYGRRQLWCDLPPWQGGGEMIDTVTLEQSHYAAPPHRFEAGTSALSAIAGLGATIDFLATQPRAAMRQHEQQLVRQLHAGLQAMEWIDVISSPDDNVGIAAFRPRVQSALSSDDLAAWLDGHDIAVRCGSHCAQPLVRQLQGAWLRASVAGYNTQADIQYLLHCIATAPRQVAATPTSVLADVVHDDLSGLDLAVLRNARGWQARYGLLLQWGDERLVSKPQIRSDVCLVRGCETQAWLAHWQEGERHRFAIDAESRVIRGLGVLLLLLIDGRSSAEIRTADLPAVFAELGLARHLSVSRVNGFQSLVQQALRLACVGD